MNRLMGPREVLEIVLCEYEDGRVFYQFNGLAGGPAEPHKIHRLLTMMAHALTQPTDGVVALPISPEPEPHLYPQEVPA